MIVPISSWRRWPLTLLVLALLAASPHPRDRTSRSIERITLLADARVNGGQPVLVEIVAARTAVAMRHVQSLTAEEWFPSRTRATRDPDIVRVRLAEVPPGGCLTMDLSTLDSGAGIAVYVFARYGSPGVHRGRVEMVDAMVELGPAGFNLTELRPDHAARCALTERGGRGSAARSLSLPAPLP